MSLPADKFEYINEDAINDELKCVICSQPFQTPVIIDCKHTFCLSCITTWTQLNASCPVCRHAFTSAGRFIGVTSDALLNQLNSLTVRCLKCDKTEIKRANFEAHLKRYSKKRLSKLSHLFGKPWHSMKSTMGLKTQRRIPIAIAEETATTDHALRYSLPRANQPQVPERWPPTRHASVPQRLPALESSKSTFADILKGLLMLFIGFVIITIVVICVITCVIIALLLYWGIFWQVFISIFVISCFILLIERIK